MLIRSIIPVTLAVIPKIRCLVFGRDRGIRINLSFFLSVKAAGVVSIVLGLL